MTPGVSWAEHSTLQLTLMHRAFKRLEVPIVFLGALSSVKDIMKCIKMCGFRPLFAALIVGTLMPCISQASVIHVHQASVIHVHVDLHHLPNPFKPPSVKIGPVTGTPPSPVSIVPSTPHINVSGNGTLAKVVNGGDKVAHAPEVLAQKVGDAAVKRTVAITKAIGNNITAPFRAIHDYFHKLIDQAKSRLHDLLTQIKRYGIWVLLAAAAGLLVVVGGTSVVATLLTLLFFRSWKRSSTVSPEVSAAQQQPHSPLNDQALH